jgi:hypothetical protein
MEWFRDVDISVVARGVAIDDGLTSVVPACVVAARKQVSRADQ